MRAHVEKSGHVELEKFIVTITEFLDGPGFVEVTFRFHDLVKNILYLVHHLRFTIVSALPYIVVILCLYNV